jgi:putative cardiolipin synthase
MLISRAPHPTTPGHRAPWPFDLLLPRWLLLAALLGVLAITGGCAGLPPGHDYPKTESIALENPETTPLGKQFAEAGRAHPGQSAFRLVPAGFEGYLLRAQMIDAATKTIDLQYYIFHADESGKLLLESLLRAADRGVRVRMLIDDVDNYGEDTQIEALDAHPNIEVRLFNPLSYRGNNELLRYLNLVVNAPRLNFRMHNKQIIIDNSIVLVGGRNVGDAYFQRDPNGQQGDFETFAGGPIVQALGKSFDHFWKSTYSIPAEALFSHRSSPQALEKARAELHEHRQEKREDGSDFVTRVGSGEPLRGMLSGRLPLTWATATVVVDDPEKRRTPADKRHQYVENHPLGQAIDAAQSEIRIIAAYFVPGDDGMRILERARERGVQVHVMTNSLAANNEPLAHSGYIKYRDRVLAAGIDLYEARARPGSTGGTSQPVWLSSYGNYSLHTKLYIFDQARLFVSSMNYDQRSLHINTELGLMIDSPQLAGQASRFFDQLASADNAYHVTLEAQGSGDGKRPVWRTEEDKKLVELDKEPAKSDWQRFKVHLFSLLPLDSEL